MKFLGLYSYRIRFFTFVFQRGLCCDSDFAGYPYLIWFWLCKPLNYCPLCWCHVARWSHDFKQDMCWCLHWWLSVLLSAGFFLFFFLHLSDFPCAVLTCLWNSSGSSSHSSHFSLPPLLLLYSLHFSRSNFKAVANTPHCLVLGGWQLIWGRGWRLAARPECPVACSLECMEYYLSLNMGNGWNDDLWCTLTLQ